VGLALRGLPWALLAALACAGAPELSVPGRSGVWGYVRLVPHEGIAPHDTAGASSGYGDRRYADAELVDYSKPGFAVVYLDGEPSGAGAPVSVALRGGAAGLHFEPEGAVVAVGGRIVLENRSGEAHVVSCPAAGVLRRLDDGESLAIPAERAGELELFAPDGPDARARVFAAPGPFTAVSEAGRYALVDVEPGARTLHAWHSRFPPAARRVELAPGAVARVDLELGVGLPVDGSLGDAR
jgi:hypothetical protein